MIVHLGVVILAVGIVASTSYATRGEIDLPEGAVVHFAGHSFEFLGMQTVSRPVKTAVLAGSEVDGGRSSGRASASSLGAPARPVGHAGDRLELAR